eukprot:89164-Pleurochrysis_carterae.AAC.1
MIAATLIIVRAVYDHTQTGSSNRLSARQHPRALWLNLLNAIRKQTSPGCMLATAWGRSTNSKNKRASCVLGLFIGNGDSGLMCATSFFHLRWRESDLHVEL